MKINYRKEQEKIMNYKNGKLAVPAVPGAGKTFILTHLAVKLVKDIENEEILILTYMNSSVNNFKYKILEILEEQKQTKLYQNFQIKTIHKLGSDLIREYGDEIGIADGFQTISEANKYYMMSMIIMEYRKEKGEDLDYFLNSKNNSITNKNKWDKELVNISLRSIAKMKNKGITAKRLYSKSKKYRKDSLLRVVGELFYRYDKACKKSGILDYDDILFLTYKLLKEKSKLISQLKKQYKYIFEDEAQDSNEMQNMIINLISRGNLIKVGDANQSILGTFTSSSPEIFKKYVRTNDKVEMFTAGRSSKEIIEIANYLVTLVKKDIKLEGIRDSLQLQMIKPVLVGEYPENPKLEGYGVKVNKNLGWEEERDRTIKTIEGFIKKYPQKTMGVLMPANYRIDEVARILRKKKIKFQILSDVPESLSQVMNFLGDLLEYIARPFETRKLIKLLEDNFFVEGELETKQIISKFLKSEKIEEVIYGEKNPELGEETLKKYKSTLKKIKSVLELNQNSLEKIIIFIGEIFEIHDEKKLLLEKISYDLKKILRYNPKWSLLDVANNLRMSKNSEFSYLAKAVEEEYMLEKKENFNLTLSTYHKSKGREWDFVYLVGVDNKTFPIHLNETNYGYSYYLKKEYEYPEVFVEKEFEREFIDRESKISVTQNKLAKISENTRLLYVGITRAKEYLILSGNAENGTYYLEKIEKYIKNRNLI